MKQTYLKVMLFVAVVFSTAFGFAQTCDGYVFTSPGQPSTCTYTYTASGWIDEFSNPIAAPASIGPSESACILADNSSDNFGNMKGDFYVAPGITYTGVITTLSGILIIEGTINLTTPPTNMSGAEVYIESAGEFSITGSLTPGGDTIIHNSNVMNISGSLTVGGLVKVINYENSQTIVQGSVTTNNTFANCGLLEVVTGSLNAGGASDLKNLCTLYVHNDMNLNGDFTNDGLLIVDGSIIFNGSTFYNYSMLLIDNLVLNNDDLVGNDDTSILIVRNNAELQGGAAITGHLYFDMDDGGGFDSVCGTCTEDIDILFDVTVPADINDITGACDGNIVITPLEPIAFIDFDGVDDYIDSPLDLSSYTKGTFMAWVKLDPSFSATSKVLNQEKFEVSVIGGTNNVRVQLNDSSLDLPVSTGLILNEWAHIAVTYDASLGTEKVKVYLNGKQEGASNHASLGGGLYSSTDLFTIGKNSNSNLDYFKGCIDEVRVFDVTLTEDQLQQIVYQEIQDNSGTVIGTVIPKKVSDFTTNATVSWSNLEAYYPMTDIVTNGRTSDYSENNRIARMHNITSIQEQTAPMPYASKADGDWTQEATWLHGDVWDIETVSKERDWIILSFNNNVTTSTSHECLGLFLEADKTFTVSGDNEISNTWYLELNGTLDLKGDSQLIQGFKSDLVTSSTGKILRRQEGTSNVYWYNYWSSPVGALGVTSLIDNNTAANNPNNADFNLNAVKYGDNTAAQFTSAYDEVGKVSTAWLYTFANGVTYYDWSLFAPSAALSSGNGYTQKGTGVGGQQDYIFEGKPNNGTIVISATDVGGPGSVGGSTKTEYLFGNPYPSALDIHEFIDDNVGVISGDLQLWEQWSGASHVTTEYNGGYATVNKLSSVRAYQFVGGIGDVTTDQDGTLDATRYLPVGQGFFTEIVATGDVVFKNSQRVFVREADADGTYGTGSVFFKSSVNNEENSKSFNENAVIGTFRLNFNAIDSSSRELVLGFSNATSDEYDYGYDAKNTDFKDDDLNLIMGGQEMLMQAYAAITPDKVVPLLFKATGGFTYSIEASSFTDIDENQEIYLRDNYKNVYHDLRTSAYQFLSDSGVFEDRFEIVFQPEASLGAEEFDDENTLIYFNNKQDLLFVKGLNEKVLNITLYNVLGQSIAVFNDVSNTTLQNGLSITNLSSGMYVVGLKMENNINMNKKIIIK